MAGITRTIIGNIKVRLAQQFQLFAGLDDSLNPQFLKIDSAGRLQTLTGGLKLPVYDSTVAAYYAGTNNLQTVIYSLGGVTVATLTISYVGGTPTSDNARFLSAVVAYP